MTLKNELPRLVGAQYATGEEWRNNCRVKVGILGISELKWAGMHEFNSDDHYIYYCGHESLRRNGVPTIVNERVQNAVLGYSLKNDRMISVHFQENCSTSQ